MVIRELDVGSTPQHVEWLLSRVNEMPVAGGVRMFEYNEYEGENEAVCHRRAGAVVHLDRKGRDYATFYQTWATRTHLQADMPATVSVWDAKIWEELATPTPFQGNMYTRRGTEAEPRIMKDAQSWLDYGGSEQRLGLKPYASLLEVGVVFHSAYPFLYASPDGVIVDVDRRIQGTLEMKFCGAKRIFYTPDKKLVCPNGYWHQRMLQSAVTGTERGIFHCDVSEPFYNATDPTIPEDHGVLSWGCNDVRRKGEFVVDLCSQLPGHDGVTEVRGSLSRRHLKLVLFQAATNFVQKAMIAYKLGRFESVFEIPQDSDLPQEGAFHVEGKNGAAGIDRERGFAIRPGWVSLDGVSTDGMRGADLNGLHVRGDDGVHHAAEGDGLGMAVTGGRKRPRCE